MATATKKVHAAGQRAESTTTASESAAVSFLVIEDNGGDYRWTMLDTGGEMLAQSRTFATYEAAEQSARVARDGAASARFEPRP